MFNVHFSLQITLPKKSKVMLTKKTLERRSAMLKKLKASKPKVAKKPKKAGAKTAAKPAATKPATKAAPKVAAKK